MEFWYKDDTRTPPPFLLNKPIPSPMSNNTVPTTPTTSAERRHLIKKLIREELLSQEKEMYRKLEEEVRAELYQQRVEAYRNTKNNCSAMLPLPLPLLSGESSMLLGQTGVELPPLSILIPSVKLDFAEEPTDAETNGFTPEAKRVKMDVGTSGFTVYPIAEAKRVNLEEKCQNSEETPGVGSKRSGGDLDAAVNRKTRKRREQKKRQRALQLAKCKHEIEILEKGGKLHRAEGAASSIGTASYPGEVSAAQEASSTASLLQGSGHGEQESKLNKGNDEQAISSASQNMDWAGAGAGVTHVEERDAEELH